MEINKPVFPVGAKSPPLLPKVVRVLGPVPHRQFPKPGQYAVRDKAVRRNMEELYERLAVIETHLEMAYQAVEETDTVAARMYILNAKSSIEQCRHLVGKKSFSTKA